MKTKFKKLQDKIHPKNGNRCQYCGDIFDTKYLHIDHIIPRSLGGSDKLDNLTTACCKCNVLKYQFPLMEFYKRIVKKYDNAKNDCEYYLKIINNLKDKINE